MRTLIRVIFPRWWWARRNRNLRDGVASIGAPVRIREPVVMGPLERISIGSNVVIHENSYLQADGGIVIGSNVTISLGCTILTANHLYEGLEWDALPWSETSILNPVHVGDSVWIGFNVIILPGVTVNEGAVVGAGSVVTSDVPKCAVVAGNPARVIRYRDVETYDRLKAAGSFRLIPTDIEHETLVTE